jgi:hypothetical protein
VLLDPGEAEVLELLEVPVPELVPGVVVVEDVLEDVLGEVLELPGELVLVELLGEVLDDMLPLALIDGSHGIELPVVVLPGVVLVCGMVLDGAVGVAVCGVGEAVCACGVAV